MQNCRSNRTHRWAACVLSAFLGSAGCAPSLTPSVPVPPALASARTTAAVSTSISVQSMPTYHAAEQACARGQYRHAADILAQMARSSALTEEQRAFCRAQHQICLSHLAPHIAASKIETPDGHPKSKIQNSPASSDCGPRALLLVCQALGVRTSLPELTRAAGTSSVGTSLGGLKRAASALRLKTEALQASREALPDLPMPAIAWTHGDHYVAVLSLRGRGESGLATIHDPNSARESTISQEQLLQSCGGYLLTVRR